MFRKSVFILLLFEAVNGSGQPGFHISGGLKFGKFAVGNRTIRFSDAESDTQITLWYPAKKTGQPKMTIRDYLDPEGKMSQPDLISSLAIKLSGNPDLISRDTLVRLLQSGTQAASGAPEKRKKFPLLLWSVRYGTPEYQFLIAEYLASHGFLVAFPEDMPHEPAPWQLTDSEAKHNVLGKYLRIMEAALGHMLELDQVDPHRIGLLTWSYAGESALLLQMAHPEIRALVSLSSLNFEHGVYLGAGWPQQINPEKLRSAILLLSERVSPNGQVREMPAVFSEIQPDAYFVSFRESAHGNFNALEGMLPGVLNMSAVQPWSKGGEMAMMSYEAVCRITLAFLDQYLGSNRPKAFKRQMNKISRRLPPDFFTVYQFEK